MLQITVYQKPTCSKCRELIAALKEKGIDFEDVDYFLEPLSKEKLKKVVTKMGSAPMDLVRTKEPEYRLLEMDRKKYSDDEIIGLLVQHPQLMQRPIVEIGEKAVLARPVERIKEIL